MHNRTPLGNKVIPMSSAATQAEALFASPLQPSDHPSAAQVHAAIRASLHDHRGARGCAGVCAAEYGEHPETACARMKWALSAVGPRPIAHAA